MNQNYTTNRVSIGNFYPTNDIISSMELCWTSMAKEAKGLALKAHAGVYYQPENIPYTSHLYKVVNCLNTAFDGSFNLGFACCLGWLHDVVEDTSVTLKDLQVSFANQVCEGVAALTKNKQLTKAEQMADSLNRIINQPREVALVKMADRVANLSNPQLSWSVEKKEYYLNEAIYIHSRLAFAGKPMASQLNIAINNYKNKVFLVRNKVENKVNVFC